MQLIIININFNDAMSHILIVKRLELYMDLALYKIIILLLLLLSNNLEKGKQIDVLVMDFAKAFDKVCHNPLEFRIE